MKHIKIIILLSMFFGFSSVYAQSTNIESEKNNTENITVKTDSETIVKTQPQTLNAGEVNPATENAQLRAPQKQKEEKVFVKTRPYPSEVKTSQPQQTKSNSKAVTPADKSEIIYTPANPDPNKK